MIVVLDTNQIHNDYALERAVRLSNELRSRDHKLVLPLVVIDELRHQFEVSIQNSIEHIDKCNKSIGDFNRELGRLKPFMKDVQEISQLPTIPYDIKAQVDNRDEYINQLLLDHSIQVQPYPELRPLIERGRKYLKPFSKHKIKDTHVEIGYRDAAIWQSVINIAIENKTETVVFISRNIKDFADLNNDNKNLHLELLDDLTSLNIQDRVEYLLDISEFEDREFSHEIIFFHSLEDAKKFHSKAFENFGELVLDALQDYPQMLPLDLRGITEESEIIEIIDFFDVSIEKRWEKGKDNISILKFSIELEIKVKVIAFSSIEGFDFEENQFDSFTIIDTNRFAHEPFVRVEFESDLGIVVEIIYSESDGAKYSVLKVVPLKPSYGVIKYK